METIFSKMIKGEIPCYKVAENEQFWAFLDIQPLREGHVVRIPKIAVSHSYGLGDDSVSCVMLLS